MSQRIVIQTSNVLVSDKEKAEDFAREQGFDSLQAALRLLIKRMAQGQIQFQITQNFASPDVEKQIAASLEEIKNAQTVSYSGDLQSILESV